MAKLINSLQRARGQKSPLNPIIKNFNKKDKVFKKNLDKDF
jgi:hypothetical protein